MRHGGGYKAVAQKPLMDVSPYMKDRRMQKSAGRRLALCDRRGIRNLQHKNVASEQCFAELRLPTSGRFVDIDSTGIVVFGRLESIRASLPNSQDTPGLQLRLRHCDTAPLTRFRLLEVSGPLPD